MSLQWIEVPDSLWSYAKSELENCTQIRKRTVLETSRQHYGIDEWPRRFAQHVKAGNVGAPTMLTQREVHDAIIMGVELIAVGLPGQRAYAERHRAKDFLEYSAFLQIHRRKRPWPILQSASTDVKRANERRKAARSRAAEGGRP